MRESDRDREEGGGLRRSREGGRDAMKLVKKLTAPRKIIHSLRRQRFLNALRQLHLFLQQNKFILLSFIDYSYLNTIYKLYTLLYSIHNCINSNYSLPIKKANSVVVYRLFIDTKYAWICLVFNPIAWLIQFNHYAQLKLQVLALKCWWPIDCLAGMCRRRCLCFQGIF